MARWVEERKGWKMRTKVRTKAKWQEWEWRKIEVPDIISLECSVSMHWVEKILDSYIDWQDGVDFLDCRWQCDSFCEGRVRVTSEHGLLVGTSELRYDYDCSNGPSSWCLLGQILPHPRSPNPQVPKLQTAPVWLSRTILSLLPALVLWSAWHDNASS